MDPNEDSIKKTFKFMEEIGAEFYQIVGRDANDNPTAIVIFAKGESAKDLLDTTDKLQKEWDK